MVAWAQNIPASYQLIELIGLLKSASAQIPVISAKVSAALSAIHAYDKAMLLCELGYSWTLNN